MAWSWPLMTFDGKVMAGLSYLGLCPPKGLQRLLLFLRPNMCLSVGEPQSWRPALMWVCRHFNRSGCSVNTCPLMDGLSLLRIAAGTRKCASLQCRSQGLWVEETPTWNVQETKFCWDRAFSRGKDATGKHSVHLPHKLASLQEKQILLLTSKQ